MIDEDILTMIADLTKALDRPIGADDPVLFEGHTPERCEAMRAAIMRLVAGGKLAAGDGYLRIPRHG